MARYSMDKQPASLNDLEPMILAAQVELNALCQGKRFRMSIPVQDDDSDMAIGDALRHSLAFVRAALALGKQRALASEGWIKIASEQIVAVGKHQSLSAGWISGVISICVESYNEGCLSDRPRESATCDWRIENETLPEYWDTACGEAFVFNEGDPRDNGMKFCPYCGRELLVRVIAETTREGRKTEATEKI